MSYPKATLKEIKECYADLQFALDTLLDNMNRLLVGEIDRAADFREERAHALMRAERFARTRLKEDLERVFRNMNSPLFTWKGESDWKQYSDYLHTSRHVLWSELVEWKLTPKSKDGPSVCRAHLSDFLARAESARRLLDDVRKERLLERRSPNAVTLLSHAKNGGSWVEFPTGNDVKTAIRVSRRVADALLELGSAGRVQAHRIVLETLRKRIPSLVKENSKRLRNDAIINAPDLVGLVSDMRNELGADS